MLRFESVISQSHIMEDYLTEFAIDQKTYNFALACASEQADLAKGQQVFYNTLAVSAVNHLLGWLEFETILDKNDTCDRIETLQGLLEVSDLMLPGIGKIECCRVLEEQTTISIPVKEDRIAYIFVQISNSWDKVKLLGFIPAADIHSKTVDETVEILVADFQPFDILEDYLERIELETV